MNLTAEVWSKFAERSAAEIERAKRPRKAQGPVERAWTQGYEAGVRKAFLMLRKVLAEAAEAQRLATGEPPVVVDAREADPPPTDPNPIFAPEDRDTPLGNPAQPAAQIRRAAKLARMAEEA